MSRSSSKAAKRRSDRQGSVLAVMVVFAVAGFVMAQAISRLPAVRDALGVSTGELGLALVGGGVGSLIAMPFTARWVDRFGSRRVLQVCILFGSAGWAALSVVPNVWVMAVVMVFAGAPFGVWDVAMNIQGSHVERGRGRSWMPYFHAAFSAGAVLGAGLGALSAVVGIGLGQLPVLGLLGIVVGEVAVRAFVPEESGAQHGHDPVAADSPSRGLTRLEVLIGLVCLAGALAEGSAGDWLALLLVDERGAAPAFGAFSFMAFNLTMMIGRVSSGGAIDRWGRASVVRVGGVLTICGILLTTQQGLLSLALIGGLLWGLGAATVFPAALSAAGEISGRGNRAIATVSVIAYGAYLFGAPTIGILAEFVGLNGALLVVVAAQVLLLVLAGNLRPRR